MDGQKVCLVQQSSACAACAICMWESLTPTLLSIDRSLCYMSPEPYRPVDETSHCHVAALHAICICVPSSMVTGHAGSSRMTTKCMYPYGQGHSCYKSAAGSLLFELPGG